MTSLADIAAAAGVSIATVDRALNGRTGVHARTRSRVFRAARLLGYVAAEASLAEGAIPASFDAVPLAPVSLAFVVPGGSNTFLRNLSAALEAAASPLTRISVHRLDTYRPQSLAAGLRSVAEHADGIGVVALDHPVVRETLRDLAAAGRRVLTLVSDISDVPRIAYVGIDNRAAGRLAGFLLGRFVGDTAGPVALFAGSLRYRGHEEREMGFRAICAEDFPSLSLLPTLENEDDQEKAHSAARHLLAQQPDLRGIYSLGGGTRGIARALDEAGASGRVVFIGHELTEYTRRFLLSGTMQAVIDQDAAAEARQAVALLARAARDETVPPVPLLRVQTIFRENIPDLAATITADIGGNA